MMVCLHFLMNKDKILGANMLFQMALQQLDGVRLEAVEVLQVL